MPVLWFPSPNWNQLKSTDRPPVKSLVRRIRPTENSPCHIDTWRTKRARHRAGTWHLSANLRWTTMNNDEHIEHIDILTYCTHLYTVFPMYLHMPFIHIYTCIYIDLHVYKHMHRHLGKGQKDKQLALAAALSGNHLNQIRGLQTVQELLEGTYQVQEVSKCLDLWWQPVAHGSVPIRDQTSKLFFGVQGGTCEDLSGGAQCGHDFGKPWESEILWILQIFTAHEFWGWHLSNYIDLARYWNSWPGMGETGSHFSCL